MRSQTRFISAPRCSADTKPAHRPVTDAGIPQAPHVGRLVPARNGRYRRRVSASPRLGLVRESQSPAPSRSREDLEEIFRTYAPYVAAIGLRMLGRKDEVDDLVQDVFLAAARGLKGLRDPGTTKAWLATVAVRIARRRLRLRHVRMFLSLEATPEYSEVADEAASPEQRAMLGRLYRRLDELPVEDRLAWTLRYIEGERLPAVALLCGCSLATAKRRVTRAHEAIRKVMTDG